MRNKIENVSHHQTPDIAGVSSAAASSDQSDDRNEVTAARWCYAHQLELMSESLRFNRRPAWRSSLDLRGRWTWISSCRFVGDEWREKACGPERNHEEVNKGMILSSLAFILRVSLRSKLNNDEQGTRELVSDLHRYRWAMPVKWQITWNVQLVYFWTSRRRQLHTYSFTRSGPCRVLFVEIEDNKSLIMFCFTFTRSGTETTSKVNVCFRCRCTCGDCTT